MPGAKHTDSSAYPSSALLAGVQTGQCSKISHLVPIRRTHIVPVTSLCCLPLAMLFLVLVHYLAQGAFNDGSPTPPISKRSFESNPCTDLMHCQTIWNIIWSCLATIFSCTWVAVHPNIPCPRKREANNCIERWVWNPLLSFAEHRLPLFVCALLVPKYILAWAIRQYLTAQRIAKENKGELETLDKIFGHADL